jgi:hypothetical protein
MVRMRQPASPIDVSGGTTRRTSISRRARTEHGENPAESRCLTLGAFFLTIAIVYTLAEFKSGTASPAFIFINRHNDSLNNYRLDTFTALLGTFIDVLFQVL